MSQTVSAVYKNGTLILDKPLTVSEGVQVEIIILSPKEKTSENARRAFWRKLPHCRVKEAAKSSPTATTIKSFTAREKPDDFF